MTEHALVLHITKSVFVLSVGMIAVLEATSVISVVSNLRLWRKLILDDGPLGYSAM
jgi:hypothetical protein